MGLLDKFIRGRGFRPATAEQTLDLCCALMSERGEVSGARLASRALGSYASMPREAVEKFFDLLAHRFSPDVRQVWTAAQRYHAEPTASNLLALQEAVEPPRQELFRRLNMAPGGTMVLVELRRRLLQTLTAHPERSPVDADLLHLFRSWFNRGFLVLQRIDWNTPAATLERLIEYEAVHQVQGWGDLRRRLAADRRCYGYFHPALPGDPLIFIEVALTRGLPAIVQSLLDPDSAVSDPARADHAVFYSITSCQEGLRGVSFGNFLIKQVAEDLSREFRNIRTYTTLSPMPGFRSWLTTLTDQSDAPEGLSPALRSLLETTPLAVDAVPGFLQSEIRRLGAVYLVMAKRGDRAPLDAVARFHLANGASLARINWMGDSSIAGIHQSLGLTANYLYRLPDVEQNHEAYAREFRVVASPGLLRLARVV